MDGSFWRGKKVLVTGHTGFKGAWLSLWLHRVGAEVHGLSCGAATEPSLHGIARIDELVTGHEADIRDRGAVTRVFEAVRPQIVMHLAAQPFVRRSLRDPVETYETNVMGTVNVCEAARTTRDPPRALIVVSSDKCYENREWDWAYREDEAMGGRDPYSSSKGCAELVAAAYRRSFFAESETRLATARAGNVIGGGDWGEDRLVPDIMRAVLAGREVEIRHPDAIRPWQHVLNPLSGYARLAEALWADNAAASAFNFGPADGDARPVRDLVAMLSERWPEPIDWRVDDGPHPHEATFLKVDPSRAKTRLGWTPGWNLGQALDAIVDWYLALREGEDMRVVSEAQIKRFPS